MAPTFDTLSDHDFDLDEEEIDFSGKITDPFLPQVYCHTEIYSRSSSAV